MEQGEDGGAQERGLGGAAVESRLHRARGHLRARVNRCFRGKLTRKPGSTNA